MAKRPVRKALPAFASEAAEREYWETHDTSPFVDWQRARIAVFPNLKASTETISLRLPTALLAELKRLANKRDVPYQSLLKVFLADRVARETAGVYAPSQETPRPTRRAREPRRKPKNRSGAARS